MWPPAVNLDGSAFWTIRIGDIITILAILLAPLAAVQVQWRLQLRRERRDRKVWIFKTLMATRANAIIAEHVQALNMIDVEFDGKGKKEGNVRTAWKIYLDHLNTPFDWAKADEGQKKVWTDRMSDLLAQLLQEMGTTLGYDFDVVYLKKNVYVPVGYGEFQLDELTARKGWISILTGQRAFKMEVVSPVRITEAEPQQPVDPPEPSQEPQESKAAPKE